MNNGLKTKIIQEIEEYADGSMDFLLENFFNDMISQLADSNKADKNDIIDFVNKEKEYQTVYLQAIKERITKRFEFRIDMNEEE